MSDTGGSFAATDNNLERYGPIIQATSGLGIGVRSGHAEGFPPGLSRCSVRPATGHREPRMLGAFAVPLQIHQHRPQRAQRYDERHFQYKANPARCQRTTVSGWTRINTDFHLGQNRRSITQNNLSKVAMPGRGWRCFKTASHCRKPWVVMEVERRPHRRRGSIPGIFRRPH
jgi:hypothetical protein